MELHEIRYFLAVCATRNFTRAAERCHITQPALTRAIQKLEARLGGLLLSRARGNVHLTELGRLVQPHLEEVIAQAEAVQTRARRFLRLESAQLRLGVMPTLGPRRFIGFLARFRADFPGIEVTLSAAVPSVLSARLLADEIDLAVMADAEPFDARLRAEPLYRERFMVACAAGHPFARLQHITLADMHGQIYLQRLECEFRDRLREACDAAGVALLRSFRSEREDWIHGLVAAGLGVCFVPEFAAAHPGLLLRPLVAPEVAREVACVTVAGRRWSPALESCVRALRRHRWPEAEVDAAAPGPALRQVEAAA